MLDFLFSAANVHPVSLDAGPEFYNCMTCSHNCVGGSEQGCPAPAPVNPPAPSSWYSSDAVQLSAASSSSGAAPTQSLDAGPEFYNCMTCSHNCVGGSEQGCPAPPPVSTPAPSSWYAATDTVQLSASSASGAAPTQSLDAGPEFYNCMTCSHNCVGGSEQGCPAPPPVSTPAPSSWYAATDTVQLSASSASSATPTQSLDAGPDFYNCTSCSHNCVGGSENGCIPGAAEASIIVQDPSKMSQLAAIPPLPAAAAAAAATSATGGAGARKTVRPGVSHLYNLGPAVILGAFAATAEAGKNGGGLEGWLDSFKAAAGDAAGAVTPLGEHILRRHVFRANEPVA